MIVAPPAPKHGYRGALHIGPSESQSAAMAQGRPVRRPQRPALPVAKHAEVHAALAWFRDVWASTVDVARIHEGFASVEPGDQNGGPAWHRRFVRFIVEGPETYSPVRMAWARMRYRGGLTDRTGAVFLFVLACRDFDLRSAGLEMLGHCVCPAIHLPECGCADPEQGRHQHGACPSPSQPLFEEFVPWYAERAINRLREKLDEEPPARTVERPAWMDRIGFETGDGQVASG